MMLRYSNGNSVELTTEEIKLKEKGCCERRTGLEKTLLVIIIIFIIALLIFIAVFVIKLNEKETYIIRQESYGVTQTPSVTQDGAFTPPCSVNEDICMTSECVAAAANLYQNIDYSVDPCDDFFTFACGKWRKNTVIPEDKGSINKFTLLIDYVQIILKYLLEGDIKEDDPEAVKKVRRLYKSCVNESLIDSRGISVAYGLLQELGGWPVIGNVSGGDWVESNFDLSTLLSTMKKYSNFPLIELFVYIDQKNSSMRTIYLDQPGFGMPGREYYLRGRNNTVVLAYQNLFKLVAMAFGAKESVATQDARDVVDMETEIAYRAMAPQDRRDDELLYNLIPIRQLSSHFHDSTMLKFSWSRFVLETMKMDGVNITLSEDTEVVVRAVPYFKDLIPVLERYGRRTVANYVVWRMMKNRIENLGSRFKELIADYNKVLIGVEASGARWRSCIRYVNTWNVMGYALGRLFVEEAFDSDAKSNMLEMIKELKLSFDNILLELDWMDEDTRKIAKEKADVIADKIGYEDAILNNTALDEVYENVVVNEGTYFENVLNILKFGATRELKGLNEAVNKSEWYDPPGEVNAFYDFMRNTIYFPAGILQPPFYSKHFPRSLNYGGIGVVIGHELTHGFDDQGRQFDKDGNLIQWWNSNVITKFEDKSQCMINQYGNYSVPEANGMKVNGKNTLGENIADCAGVKQSFKAYRNWVKSRGKEEPKLPGLNFTNNQLFFLNYANTWCTNMRIEEAKRRILTSVHSPPQFRIIGPLQNSEDFAREFNCPVGSYMNPEKKCYVW